MNTQSEQGGVTKPRLEMAAKQTIPSSFLSAFMMRGECGISMNRRCVACARWFVADLLQWEPQVQARVGRQIEFCDLESWRGQYGASISVVAIKFTTRNKIWMVARLLKYSDRLYSMFHDKTKVWQFLSLE